MRIGWMGAAAFWVLAAMPANATLITSQGALASNDSIDWLQVGPPSLTTVYSGPLSVTSNLGATATVTSAGNSFKRVDQGGAGGWNGNFTPGDHLLWTGNAGPYITITFGTPVFGVGAQIESTTQGGFVARITLSNGNSFTENGNSTLTNDGTVIFIGALDSIADISSITFILDSVATARPNDFAIDKLFLNTIGPVTDGPVGVPEPATLAVFGAGLAGLGALRRRRKARAA